MEETEKKMVIEIIKDYTDIHERVFSTGDIWKLPKSEAEELIDLGIAERSDK